jgi:hypothetical protein
MDIRRLNLPLQILTHQPPAKNKKHGRMPKNNGHKPEAGDCKQVATCNW